MTDIGHTISAWRSRAFSYLQSAVKNLIVHEKNLSASLFSVGEFPIGDGENISKSLGCGRERTRMQSRHL